MGSDRVSITVEDETWEHRMTRLKSLDSVIKSSRRAEFKCRVHPLLYDAVKEGSLDKFIEALGKYSAEENVPLSDIQGPSGNSLLHAAAGTENADILQALLEVIPDKRLAVNHRGDTALHVAARAGRFCSAMLLLGYGRIVHMANDAGNTALHEAVKKGDAELFLGCGRIVHMANDAGNTALHEAVKTGDPDLTLLLLSLGSRAVYPENKESKCPLYLAVETGNLEILELLMEAMDEYEIPWSRMQGMSPVHGAVMHRRFEMMEVMSKREKKLFNLRDARNGTPLHLAASVNYVKGVKFLVKHFGLSAFECDTEGYLPIHVACKMGHLETIKELLGHSPYPEEMLTSKEGKNILHVAAKYGMAKVVRHILGEAEHEKLINAKDKDGNTPLHVATLEWRPEVLLSLTRDKRVDLKLENNQNLTALDIVDERLKEADAPLHQSLTRIILVSAKVPRSKDRAICGPEGLDPGRDMKPLNLDRLKAAAETRMVVATLVAAMTFAAGFSVPGGYNGSKPDAGIATLLDKPMYNVFVICNTIAMYSSIITVVILLWTQINDAHAMYRAITNARLPLLIALATMSMAFLAGVYVTISKRTWIAAVALIIGITCLFVILGLYSALFVRLKYNCRLVQFLADYIIKVAISISRSEGRAKPPAQFRDPNTERGATPPRVSADVIPEVVPIESICLTAPEEPIGQQEEEYYMLIPQELVMPPAQLGDPDTELGATPPADTFAVCEIPPPDHLVQCSTGPVDLD